MKIRMGVVIGSLAAGTLLGHADHAESQSFPADADWVPVTRASVVIFDPALDTSTSGSARPRDVVNSDEPAALVYADESFFYFRLRVDGDPTAAFVAFGWVVEMDLNHDATDYEALAMVDGGTNVVKFYSGEHGNEPSDVATQLAATFPVATHARTVSDGSSDFFVDWAIPKPLLFDAGSDGDSMRLVFGANTNMSPSLVAGNSGDIAGVGFTFGGTFAEVASDLMPIPCAAYGCFVGVPQKGGPPAGIGLTVTPNPMQGRGRFDFYAESALVAELSVYSVDGRRVRRFSSLETVGGWQSVTWDGRDHFGRPAPSGIYSAVLRAGHSTVRRKFALMK